MHKPFISIITATYNAAASISCLLDSLTSQTFRDFELVLQDGDSRDDTVALVESRSADIPHLSLVSEPDKGIYDAWNKAVARVRGEWVIFLGADDSLVSESTLMVAYGILRALPENVLFCPGDVVMCDGDADLSVVKAPGGDVVGAMRRGNPVVYAGLFHRVRILAGRPYDTSFKFIGDYDFLCRSWTHNYEGACLGFAITRMSIGGVTNSLRYLLQGRYETAWIVYRHFGCTALLPHIPGVIKGIVPFILSRFFKPETANYIYNRLREARSLPPAAIK